MRHMSTLIGVAAGAVLVAWSTPVAAFVTPTYVCDEVTGPVEGMGSATGQTNCVGPEVGDVIHAFTLESSDQTVRYTCLGGGYSNVPEYLIGYSCE
ncbi:hypothetical protein ACIBFB_22460 [Nocardiopsis sp. NPDC050513]|uniref:hypothetical protein n=1 Tax=Nocardiopsis sp. NPDC050513 TaxID=3364338 RepID=UPI0037B405E5